MRIYGSQKGVHSHELQIFEDLIQHWGNLFTTASNQHIFELKGGGANGGVPAAIVAYHSQKHYITVHHFLLNLPIYLKSYFA